MLDERFNHGGQLADYIIDYLKRTPMSRVMTREGEDVVEPAEAIYGPKVMIVNQIAGSGGDALPWYFRKAGLGPLVGVRTWGGLVGIGGYPPLMDGGRVTAPRWALYGTPGEWEVENDGDRARHRGRAGPDARARGARPATRAGGADRARAARQEPTPEVRAAAVPGVQAPAAAVAERVELAETGGGGPGLAPVPAGR